MRICSWCGIKVRWWQKFCASCRLHFKRRDVGIYLQEGGSPPPCHYMSRFHRNFSYHVPDIFKKVEERSWAKGRITDREGDPND